MPLDPKGGSVGLGGVKPELEGPTCTLSLVLFKYIFWPGVIFRCHKYRKNGALSLY